jgi:uncharacterized repeat protein (TIGR02543 family)
MLTIMYKVTYQVNGGTGTAPIDTNSYAKGESVTTATASLTLTGYTFSGWNTNATGTGTTYATNGTFIMESASVILYAKWNGTPVWKTMPTSDTINYRSTMDLSQYCTDPDGDNLTFTVVSGTGATISGTTLTYCANNENITIKATDTHSASASATFSRKFKNPELMKLISSGIFIMGGILGSCEEIAHSVTISGNFYMDSTEVTQNDYLSLMGVNPSYYNNGGQQPVENVTWFDAVLYCNARSNRDGLDTVYKYKSLTGTAGDSCTNLEGLEILSKNGYRLPTEAEWEYACRAGTTTELPFPEGTSGNLYGWSYTNCTRPQIVGQLQGNAWGLYDIVGNVAEWCNDWYGDYSSGAQTDPTGAISGTQRVLRGNYSFEEGTECLKFYSAARSSGAPNGGSVGSDFYGFRCVRTR